MFSPFSSLKENTFLGSLFNPSGLEFLPSLLGSTFSKPFTVACGAPIKTSQFLV